MLRTSVPAVFSSASLALAGIHLLPTAGLPIALERRMRRA